MLSANSKQLLHVGIANTSCYFATESFVLLTELINLVVCQVNCASEHPSLYCHLLCLALAKLTICQVRVWNTVQMEQYFQFVYQTSRATSNDRYPGHLVICSNCHSSHHVIILLLTLYWPPEV